MDFLRGVIVRAGVVVALLLASAGAHAACNPPDHSSTNSITCETQWEALWQVTYGGDLYCQSGDPTRYAEPAGALQHNTVQRRYTQPTLCKNSSGSTVGGVNISAAYQTPTECQEGADGVDASLPGMEHETCVGGCMYQCTNQPGESNGVGCFSFNMEDGEGWSTVGYWSQTGETCGIDDEEEAPEPLECQELGDTGFTFCESDPPGCVRSPGGAMLCPEIPGPDCATAPSGAACSNQSPPEGYAPPRTFTVCPSTGCVPITVAPPEDEEEEEDEPDCPASDPDCEDDDDDDKCPEGTVGTPPNCEPEETGLCEAGEETICDILRDIRTATQATADNTAEIRGEAEESNVKLAAIKDQLVTDAKSFLSATNRVQVAVDSVRQAIHTQSSSINASTTAAANRVANSVDANTSAVVAGLEGVANAVAVSSPCGGPGEPACEAVTGGEGVDGVTVDTGSLDTSGDHDSGVLASEAWGESEEDDFVFDDGGFFGGSRDCPVIEPPSLPWGQVEFSLDFMCDAFSILATMIVLGAYAQAAFIIGGRR